MPRLAKLHLASLTVVTLLVWATGVHAAPCAYISNYLSNNVSVIDTATNTVIATIPVGSEAWGVAVKPDGTRVYVTDNNVSVIDTALKTVIATISVGADPEGVAVGMTPNGERVYVANSNSNTVSVINTATNMVIATVGVGSDPTPLAISPDGSKVYVGGRSVTVIETTNNTVVTSISVEALGIAFTPNGARAYVTDSNAQAAKVIDTTTNTVIASVPVGIAPRGVVVNPLGTRTYVANNGGASVTVIDVASNTVIQTVSAGSGPFGLDITLDGTLLYVANHTNNGTVSVINTTTLTIVNTIPAGTQPVAMGRFIGGPINCSPVLNVAIDIKPGSFPNCFNIDGNGVIPVAILGSTNFDVTDIDVNTLSFAGLDVRVRGNNTRQCSVEDVSGNFTSPEGDPDGYPDLVCQFVDDPNLWSPDDGTATLTGNLLDGTPIEGTDSICLVR